MSWGYSSSRYMFIVEVTTEVQHERGSSKNVLYGMTGAFHGIDIQHH